MANKASSKPLIPLDSREVLSSVWALQETDSRRSKACHVCGNSVDNELGNLHESHSDLMSAWAVAICIVCTFINCLLTSNPSLFDPIFSATRQQFDLLHYSLPPIPPQAGSKTQSPSPLTPGTILSYPSFIAHVDADREQDTNFNKLISSADERVEITLMTSTIVQFDDVDFGVERCELQLRYDFDDNLDDQAFSISVYQLDIAAHLDTPPQRRDRVDTFQVTPGTAFDWRNSLSCSWGERLTFEFACSDARSTSSNCLMKWWQRRNEEDPNKAIFMLQYPSQ